MSVRRRTDAKAHKDKPCYPVYCKRFNMLSISEYLGTSNSRRAAVLLMDWNVAGITPPNVPQPVPENPTPSPQEMPERREPIGDPGPIESPVPVREPPMTLPPQS